MSATPRQRTRLRNLGSPLADREELTNEEARDAILELERGLPPTPALRHRAEEAGLTIAADATRGQLEEKLYERERTEELQRLAVAVRAAVKRLVARGAQLPETLRESPARIEAIARMASPPDDGSDLDEAGEIESDLEMWEQAWSDAQESATVDWEGGKTKIPSPKAWTMESLERWGSCVWWMQEALEGFDSELHHFQHPDQPKKATKTQMKRAATALIEHAAADEIESREQCARVLALLVHREAMRDAAERAMRDLEAARAKYAPTPAPPAPRASSASPTPSGDTAAPALRSWWRRLLGW